MGTIFSVLACELCTLVSAAHHTWSGCRLHSQSHPHCTSRPCLHSYTWQSSSLHVELSDLPYFNDRPESNRLGTLTRGYTMSQFMCRRWNFQSRFLPLPRWSMMDHKGPLSCQPRKRNPCPRPCLHSSLAQFITLQCLRLAWSCQITHTSMTNKRATSSSIFNKWRHIEPVHGWKADFKDRFLLLLPGWSGIYHKRPLSYQPQKIWKNKKRETTTQGQL